MEQYEKSGPKQQQQSADPLIHDIKNLEQLVKEQGKQIGHLMKEIARIKRKMDIHAAAVNKINNG